MSVVLAQFDLITLWSVCLSEEKNVCLHLLFSMVVLFLCQCAYFEVLPCSDLCYGVFECSQASNENLPPNVIKQLAKELKSLDESPPDGIKVVVNDEDFSQICADIEGPGALLFPYLMITVLK